MKITLLSVLMALSLNLIAQRTVPSVNIQDLDGKTVNITDFTNTGELTVLSFWATWCTPCKRELNNIADLYPEWQEKYEVKLVAVSIDNARTFPQVRPYVMSQDWEYTVLSDINQNLQRALGFQTVPQTFLIDRNGHIVYDHNGYVDGDEYILEEQIIAHHQK